MISNKDIGKIVYRNTIEPFTRGKTLEGKLLKVTDDEVQLKNRVGYYALHAYGEWFVKEKNNRKEITTMKEFYILWHPEGQLPPTRKFDTLRQAEKVAEILLTKIGSGTMYVMKVASGCSLKNVSWEKAA